MTPSKQQVLEYGEKFAKKVEHAYFDAETINGISPQCPDDAARIGFQQALELLWPLVEAVKKETDNAANECECHLCKALSDLEQKIGESDA